MSLGPRLRAVRERIAGAAERVGRDPRGVTLVAVSKFQPVEAMEQAYAAGQRCFGENRVQEVEAKGQQLLRLIQNADPLRLELIGPLQSNKVRKAVSAVSRIQSIDSAELGERVSRVALEMGTRISVLVQVDLAGEVTKTGIPEAELHPVLERLQAVVGIRVEGLMAIPPFLDDPEEVRPFFARLRVLRDEALRSGLLAGSELSMGMSHDFEVAIEEGATIVRVGTAIFGERPAKTTWPRSVPED